MQEMQVHSLGWKDPLEEDMATQSSILAWRIPMDRGAWLAVASQAPHGQRSLAGYSPWGHKESDVTEVT